LEEKTAPQARRSVPGELVVYGFLRRSETHFASAANWRQPSAAVRLEIALARVDIAKA
jgi:hypothetical protein